MKKIVEKIKICEAVIGILDDNIVDFFHHRKLEWVKNPFPEYPYDEILISEQMLYMCPDMYRDIEKYEKILSETVLDVVVDEIVFYVDHMADEKDTPTYIIEALYLCEQLCDLCSKGGDINGI